MAIKYVFVAKEHSFSSITSQLIIIVFSLKEHISYATTNVTFPSQISSYRKQTAVKVTLLEYVKLKEGGTNFVFTVSKST